MIELLDPHHEARPSRLAGKRNVNRVHRGDVFGLLI